LEWQIPCFPYGERRRTAEESRTTYDGSRKVENLRRENAAAIELKIVGNLSLYFNFKEIFKNLICYLDFLLKKTKKMKTLVWVRIV
jgi:hypothetical protein